MFQEKGLEAHPDKTCFIVFGSENFKRKINEQLNANPLQLGNFMVNRRVSDRYLGQFCTQMELRQVWMQQFLIEQVALREQFSKSIIATFEMQAIGGIMTGWELWERALLPSLLSGAGTWMGGYQWWRRKVWQAAGLVLACYAEGSGVLSPCCSTGRDGNGRYET